MFESKPVQEREPPPRFASGQEFGRDAVLIQLPEPRGGAVFVSLDQVQTSCPVEDRTAVNAPGAEAANPFHRQSKKDGIGLHLSRHGCVAAGSVDTGQRLPLENHAASSAATG
jgi:hypothetical protein